MKEQNKIDDDKKNEENDSNINSIDHVEISPPSENAQMYTSQHESIDDYNAT